MKNIQSDIREFLNFQQKYPKLVKKLQKKFNKFNLTTSQLLKFIKIEEKFINITELSSSLEENNNRREFDE